MEEKRKKAEYRSSIRSKTLIRSALVSLMQEKPFEKITITDIVRKADINRGTFYAHFKDSREVLDRIRTDALHELEVAFYSLTADYVISNPSTLLDKITMFLSEESSYYKMLLSTTGIQEFLNEIFDVAADGTNDIRLREGVGFDNSYNGYTMRKYKQENLYACTKNTVPLIRLSEMYYILAECATTPENAADFLNKINVALKEANETLYWLSLLKDTGYLSEEEYLSINNDAKELVALLVSIVKSMKSKLYR